MLEKPTNNSCVTFQPITVQDLSSETYCYEGEEGPGDWYLHPDMTFRDIECEHCDDGQVECPDCDSTGHEEDSEDPCGACDGDGYVECQECGGDGTYDEDDTEDDWWPAMNYLYPLPDNFELPDNWRDALVSTTVIIYEGKPHLALTGGGMDMSWAICETYIRLGYLPPTHFASLPRMAGRGDSDKDHLILAACRRSLELQANWARAEVERFIEQFEDKDYHGYIY